MKKIVLTLCFLGLTVISKAQTTELFFEQATEFLKKNVAADGKVDYFKIKKSPGELIYILDNIASLDTKFSDKKVAKAFPLEVYLKDTVKP